MNAFRLATILLLSLATTGTNAQIAQKSTGLWHWFQSCKDSRSLRIEVLVDNKIVHRSSFPICHTVTANLNTEHEQRFVKFHFAGGHLFQGKYRTTSNQVIEGNIWQAGTDPDALLLGVSLMTNDQVLLNTIHTAKANGQSVWELDRGIVVKTFPVEHDSSD